MSKQARVSHPLYGLFPANVEEFDSLAELALDMRWSWNHADDEVWRQLDSELWEITQNPWVVLQTVSRDKLQRVSADRTVREYTEQHYIPTAAAYRERAADYTARMMPNRAGVAVPLEDARILWQR